MALVTRHPWSQAVDTTWEAEELFENAKHVRFYSYVFDVRPPRDISAILWVPLRWIKQSYLVKQISHVQGGLRNLCLCHVACIFEPHELIHLNEIKSRVHSSGQGRVTDVGSSR